MGDDEMDYGIETRFHLWRRYNAPPYRRFALTVERSKAPEGYTVIDHDPRVADAAFLSKFGGFMRSPMDDCFTGYIAKGVAVTEAIPVAQPGTIEHYGNAVRRFPNCARMSVGRES